MFLGYSENHSHENYRILNLKTKKVRVNRDIKWLKKSYRKFFGIKSVTVAPVDTDKVLVGGGDDDSTYSASGKTLIMIKTPLNQILYPLR